MSEVTYETVVAASGRVWPKLTREERKPLLDAQLDSIRAVQAAAKKFAEAYKAEGFRIDEVDRVLVGAVINAVTGVYGSWERHVASKRFEMLTRDELRRLAESEVAVTPDNTGT